MENPFDDAQDFDDSFEEGCRALGLIVYFFQQLEENLRSAVAFLIEPSGSEIGPIVVCELSFKQLVHLADSLFGVYVEAQDSNNLAEWRALLSAAFDAESERNSILHSTFGVSSLNGGGFQRNKVSAKFKKGLREQVELLSGEALNSIVSRSGGTATLILDFMGRVFPDWNIRRWNRSS